MEDVWVQVNEEIAELKEAYLQAPKSDDGRILREADPEAAHAVELEIGDVLFSLVNVARKMGVDAEAALRDTCTKFRLRWAFMEGAAAAQGKPIESLSMVQLEELWALAKAQEGRHDR